MALPVDQFFQSTMTPTFTGQGLIKRVPFTFTSTARLIKAGAKLGNDLSRLSTEIDTQQQLRAIENETRPILNTATTVAQLGASVLPDRPASGVGSMSVISMAVNPNTVKWTQPKRYVKRDTQEGSIFFHFTNTTDQNNDILVCQFSGQTGNINTNINLADALKVGSNLKLRVWHELYNLSREGMLLNKTNCGKDFGHTIRNEFFITYKTALMIVPITLVGFFNQVLDFTETAADPFNRNYTFSFTVTDTSPKLDTIVNKLSTSLALNNFSPLPVNLPPSSNNG